MFKKLRSLDYKWVMYDVGNSAFILLTTSVVPIYFNSLATGQGLSSDQYLTWWSYAMSVATIIVALAGPVMGTLADFPGNKKKIFLANALGGALLLFCLWIPKSWIGFLILFVMCKVLYSVSLVVYDSMLVDVCDKENMDDISSKGYAWGYIGSCVPFIISLVLILLHESIGIGMGMAMALAFAVNAAWWVFFTLPLARSYKQKYSTKRSGAVFSQTFKRLGATLKLIVHEKKVLYFMIAFFFYIDGVYTIIDLATAYGTSLGLDQTGLLLALLLTQIVAFPSAIYFGYLAKKKSTGSLIKVGILAYFCIAIFGLFLKQTWQFWVLACAVGLFQGGIQALSRSYFAQIIPENQSGEYFGLYDIAGKGASFLGTMIVGLVTQITGHQNIAVGTLALLFLVGFFIFSRADKLDNPVYDK